jgi:Tat protein secretion system quality control protein TatD with DNase activity
MFIGLPLFLHCRAAAKDLVDILGKNRSELFLDFVRNYFLF